MSEFPKLSQPALRALHNAGIADLYHLSKLTEKEFSRLHGIGPTAIKALREAMAAKGLTFVAG
ncbi:MAG: hypothetical protein JST19_14185 [Bacteroidetes bacterium]|nr:hypothetical protein [Bacteroidota bacterium]